MFKFLRAHRHTFTCPDIIHLRNRQKKINRLSLLLVGGTFLALWGYGVYLDRKEPVVRELGDD